MKPDHVLCQPTHAHSKTEFCKTPQKPLSFINVIYSTE